ncbi:MAG: thioredoxin family protein [Rhodoferax sp.]|uniref:thioredoxin fold domain-containing protein n=1 Tax=Rhodoferax sp. TaxID=50421 RepID=UPI002603B854|nr:thioredoxin fold domain-containing protein [Rhodoferax sp.]MDD2880253.1 thioredoxin family protein [Rhodoferax sp.]
MRPSSFFITRRQWLLAGVTSSLVTVVHSAGVALPVPTSLPDELAAALKRGSPLLVMVSLEGCPFCKVARENYLAPLQRQAGLAMVQIDMRNRQMVQDFGGNSQTQDQLIRSWGIKVAPTVLFFGRGGAEVAERLVGGYIPDFYGAYLDDRLRTARAAVAN